MITNELISLIFIFILSMIQSVVGIGVLVVGTPTLLITGMSIENALGYLLPISIFNSLVNLIIIKFKNRVSLLNLKFLKSFLFFCIPSVFFGLILLKYFKFSINIGYFVSFVIICSIIFKERIKQNIKKLPFFLTNLLLVLIGIFHGITNAGGTLLSIFLLSTNQSKLQNRNHIVFFYFLLATFQFIIFIIIFEQEFIFTDYFNKVWAILIGVMVGNLLFDQIKQQIFEKAVYFLAFTASVFLFCKIFFDID